MKYLLPTLILAAAICTITVLGQEDGNTMQPLGLALAIPPDDDGDSGCKKIIFTLLCTDLDSFSC